MRPVTKAADLDGKALFEGKATCVNCHQLTVRACQPQDARVGSVLLCQFAIIEFHSRSIPD